MFTSLISYKDFSVFHIYSCLDESLQPATLLKLQVNETINFNMASFLTVYEAVDWKHKIKWVESCHVLLGDIFFPSAAYQKCMF